MQITVSTDGKHQYRQRGAAPPEGGEADRMVARSPGAALMQMNAVRRRPGLAWMVLAGGAACALPALWVHFLLAVPLAALTTALFLRLRAADARRRRFHLNYKLDADARERWTLLNHALAALTRTDRLWQITSRGHARGWKRDSGASALVTRTDAVLRRECPAGLTSSVAPYCLRLGAQRWVFLPDRLYVLHNGAYVAAEYAQIKIKTGTTRFMEEGQVPRDAQVVGRPWRRQAPQNAPGLAITEYGVLELESRSGPSAVLHVSSVGAAEQFAALFRSFQTYRRSDGPMPPPPPPSEGCYGRLGLTPSCTKPEATRQFRRLVLLHHPDRVSGTAPDVPGARERANAEMQEIVLAYKDLKRLRGW